MIRILISISVLLSFIACNKTENSITLTELINNADYDINIDFTNKIIVTNDTSISVVDNKLSLDSIVFNINTSETQLNIGQEYSVDYNGEEFNFYVSQLPILHIITQNESIPNEPKIAAKLSIQNAKKTKRYNIAIETRGRLSKDYPKPSFAFELRNKENQQNKLKQPLLGMRTDDDWILDGMWNEPLRIRDFSSHDIWLNFGRLNTNRQNITPGINRKYCELFVNNQYKGCYFLGERIDRKQLGLKKHNNRLEGELYKGSDRGLAVSYSGIENFNNTNSTWSGFIAKYPKQDEQIDWTNLYKHVSFVLYTQTADFKAEMNTRIDIQNAIDYFIFINLLSAYDNTGKNIYTAKFEKNAPYFFIPWDLDGSFGNNAEGNRSNLSNEIISNGLYDRLLTTKSFKTDLKNRWLYLRANELKLANIVEILNNNYNFLLNNGVYERELLVADLAFNYSVTEIDFIESWLSERLLFLDNYYSSLQ